MYLWVAYTGTEAHQPNMKRRDFLTTIATAALPAGAHMPTAAKEPPRQRLNFNEGWLFRRQEHGGGALGSWDRDASTGAAIEPAFQDAWRPAYDDSRWEPVFLPHTSNAHDGCDDMPGYFRGIGWYRKRFQLDGALAGKRVFLEFEGVNQVSEFWVNGVRVGEHQGGYTSFEFDVTAHVRFGTDANVLTVKVDNLYNPNIAPTVKTDLTYYGGIYRDVWLRVSEPVYLTDVYWRTPRVSESEAAVEVYATVVNTTGQGAGWQLAQKILDPAERVVAESAAPVDAPAGGRRENIQRALRIVNPGLWSPDSPQLYRVRATLTAGDRVVDTVEVPLGLRWFHFDANQGFFLNGRRLQLRGTTWHQSYPGMGDALPNSRHVKDMENIRAMGCNFFRTSHYPHDPAVMEACDRLGLLVLEELFVGEEVENTREYYEIQARTAEEMIVRDRNNPSVIMWGFSGEVDEPMKSAEVVVALVKKYRELDPTRVITMHAPRVEPVQAALDVVGLYYEDFKLSDRDHRRFPTRKFLIEEYTAAGIGRGIYGMGPESEDLGCVKHEDFLRQVNLRPWIAGSVLWHQFDYDGEEYDPVIPHVVTFGLADSWRIPKDAYYFYQSQWSSQPVLHICGHWTWPGDENQPKNVKVYSNLDELELLLNGRSLGVRRKAPPDGLEHPPFVWQVPYEPGTLKAVARSGARPLTDERKTAGAAARIALRSDVDRVRSGDRDSLAYLTAAVVDRDGTVVPSAHHPITFTPYGPGELLPQTWPGHATGFTWNAIAGMTGIAFRATARVGRAVITAYSPGLMPGRVEIQVAAPGKRDEMEYRGGATVYK